MTAPRPTLEDPLHVLEVFASEVTGVGIIHGNVAITLANVRFDESAGKESPQAHRIVVSRLVLTNHAARQLVDNLQKLAVDAATMSAPNARMAIALKAGAGT